MKSDLAKTLLVVVLGITAVVGVAVIALAVTYPEVVEQSTIGAEFFLADLGAQGKGLQAVTGFRPLADGLLFVCSYILVSLIAWSQTKLADYLRTREHVR